MCAAVSSSTPRGLEAGASAAGLTLTCARHVVFVDVLNSELLEAQAKARVSRIGQRFPTTAWHLVAQDSVDVPLRAAAIVSSEWSDVGSAMYLVI